MKRYIQQLQKNDLFKNFNLNNIEIILNCLSAKIVTYNKRERIFLQGDPINFVGIILSGSIRIIKEDIEGNCNILAHLGVNDIFAEAFACAGIDECPVTIQALENCEILFIDCKRIIRTCHQACTFHSSLIQNILSLISKKNILLNEKIEILSKRTIREKLMAYLNMQIQSTHSKKFSIPYDREGLANYLCIDRSALSRELCNMRNEGVIAFKKNEFEIL
ncbi:Crp/Fnr family transcriptional regulator [Sporanaerobium hydrogeniformans]|uniref:Crp/Fnr family transcriptional regulator n=1 Tax=Sporanaerobium hydrogeniformans TaxID=3072179 RepID=A0AC61DCT2_9FIRM|nr:Crp/Fnr family transcriptional regulator [Sporanaerobium hydrogeniformans]PHV70715.1 Crp/Fnr family transcriptional regulator [Sporanaerobium hydrogeniformans]